MRAVERRALERPETGRGRRRSVLRPARERPPTAAGPRPAHAPPTRPSPECRVGSGTGRGSCLSGNVGNAGSRGVTAPSVRKPPVPEKSPSSRMFLGAWLKVQEGWEGAVTSRRAGCPPASTSGRALPSHQPESPCGVGLRRLRPLPESPDRVPVSAPFLTAKVTCFPLPRPSHTSPWVPSCRGKRQGVGRRGLGEEGPRSVWFPEESAAGLPLLISPWREGAGDL